MNILLLTSHSIAEYDDLRMFTDLGYKTFSIGAYTDPAHPSDDKRPALDAPYYADMAAMCEQVRRDNGDPGPYIDWAKAKLHPEIIEWADVIIVHHFPERWIGAQWPDIMGKRVIWRTCGQSDPVLELQMRDYKGLEIVRYSPAERRAFEPLGVFAGQDALIRFGKYPEDYAPRSGDYPFWVGDWPVIGNITQHMAQRGEACGYGRWKRDTGQMLTKPAGPGSEVLPGGMGALDYPAMLEYLRRIRVYLYTGTVPASYTLGLIEAMLSGVPVVTHPWEVEYSNEWLGRLWEASEIVGDEHLSPDLIPARLGVFLDDQQYAQKVGQEGRARARELFDVATVGKQWKAFLG